MKIFDLSLYIINLPFRFSFKHNLAERSYSTNLIVKALIETPDGQLVTGYGEGIPREYVTGETVEQSSYILKHKYFPRLTGQSFSNTLALVDFLKQQFQDCGLEENSNGAAWCALELALLDAACKAEKMSLAQLLTANNIGTHNGHDIDRIRYGATASLTNRKSLLALLTFFKLYGFSTIKLKVGKNLEDDLENIKLARSIMGSQTTIRVDANCAWSVVETLQFARAIEKYNVVSIEQPIEANDLEGLAQLASSIPQTIVVDESLCTINQAKELISRQIKIDFNIRISKVGGLIAANNIRQLAKQAGIPCHLGAQVGESGILTAAGRIFALSYGPFVNHEGAANSFLLKQDITKENLTYSYGGIGKLPSVGKRTSLGLGVSVDENKLVNLLQNATGVNALAKVVVGR